MFIFAKSQTVYATVLMFQSGHLPPSFPQGCASRRLQKQGAGGKSRRQRGAQTLSSLLRIYTAGEKKWCFFPLQETSGHKKDV